MGLESSGDASGHSLGPAGPKVGGGDSPVQAGTRPSSSSSHGSVCEHLLRAEYTRPSSKPA